MRGKKIVIQRLSAAACRQMRGRIVSPLLLLVCLSTACSALFLKSPQATQLAPTATAQQVPVFVDHPRPVYRVDLSVFENAGCRSNSSGTLLCEVDSPLVALGCTEGIKQPSDLLGALDPPYPIAVCRFMDGKLDTLNTEGRYIYWLPYGPGLIFVRYIIFRDGQFTVIENKDEFQGIYVPVGTADEALSYALALTNLSAYYDLRTKVGPGYQYNDGVDKVEDTYVEPAGNGFVVHLFEHDVYNNCPPFTEAVDVEVTNQGIVQEIKRVPIYWDSLEKCLER